MPEQPDTSPRSGRAELLRLLVAHLAEGKIPPAALVPALHALAGEATPPITRRALLEAVAGESDPAFSPLLSHLRSLRARDAQRHHEIRMAGRPVPADLQAELGDLPTQAPLGWAAAEELPSRLREAVRLLRDRLFIESRRPQAPRIAEVVEAAYGAARERLRRAPSAWALLPAAALVEEALGADVGADREATALRAALEQEIVDDHARARDAVAVLAQGGTARLDAFDDRAVLAAATMLSRERAAPAERRSLLDLALTWPSDPVADFLPDMCSEPWARERAALVLTLRFGTTFGDDWSQWQAWLRSVRAARADRQARPPDVDPAELLLLWYSGRPGADPRVERALEARCRPADRVTADAFVQRWHASLSFAESEALLGIAAAGGPPVPPPLPSGPPPAAAPPTLPPPPRVAPRPPRQPEPERASVWREHVQTFLAENWYMVAGVAMVLVGASLLAYFTWDKHWLLRYTIMPGLLAAFTAALAGAASWLEGRDRTLRGTAAVLRAAAILLLPMNFMAVALLGGDPQVTRKLLAVPAMSALYLALAGWGVGRWCRAVDARLVPSLPVALLVLNALVLLRPLAAGLPRGDRAIVLGFYLGFLVVAAAAIRFTTSALDAGLAAERRVPGFVTATLVLTFLMVFVLVNAPARPRPSLHAYAALAVLAGGLVLFVERRFLALRGEGRVGTESFLGFALILLGVLMGAGDPWTRILTLVLAGVVWLVQAGPRGEALHHWIGMTLAVLGGASVGLLPGFPGAGRPALGIALALAVGATGSLSGSWAGGTLRATCRGLQPTVLVLTTVVAVLQQWHDRSAPLRTAAVVLAVAALLAWRAHRDQSLRLLHTVTVHLALALPYVGFVDVLGRDLRGNTMPFGLALLSWLWIALVVVRPGPLLREARSTVLFLYGGLALAAMLLRVVVERQRAVDPHWHLAYPEHLGPILMAGALGFATYWSRSLLPAAVASFQLIILFPALKADFQAAFPGLGWGTGLGSAVSALALVLACFRLRASPALRDLGEGDRFLGSEPFPLRRFDHTLFTGPLLASAVFLLVKADTWTIARHLDYGVPLKTAIALLTSGAAWTLLAVYWRERAVARALVHLGWVAVLGGVWFGYWRLRPEGEWQWPLVITGVVVQALELAYRRLLAPGRPWAVPLLADPLREVLRAGSTLVSLMIVAGLVGGQPVARVQALGLFVGLQLAWTAIVERSVVAGSCLAGLSYVTLLAASAPGRGPLARRLSVEAGLTETLVLILIVQIALIALERRPRAYDRGRPILLPAQVGATALAACLGLFGLIAAINGPTLSLAQAGLLTAGVALLARAHGSGPFALLGSLLVHALVHDQSLRALPGPDERAALLAEPLRLSVLALVMAGVGIAGRALAARSPSVLEGPFPLEPLRGPVAPFLHVPAALFALLAAERHTAMPDMRRSAAQLPAPYLAALTYVVVGASWGLRALFWTAAALLGLANIHAVRLFFGEPMRSGGVSDVHLAALGLGLTLLQGTILRTLARSEAVTAFVNRASLVLAALVLTLLTVNYAAQPDLTEMTSLRFVVSGAMALAAGLYFRRAARRPGQGEEAYVDLSEALYHFGLATAVWCAALLVPWFRQPSTALLALGLPAVGFWARAELERGSETGRRFRDSAGVLGFLLLGLYALRPVFQMVLFPDTAIQTDHYHYYAGFAMALGLLLLRLHGLGGTDWLAFYGGLSLMTGSYFGLTAWPGLSPFEHAVPAAWCGVALAHFWTVASAQRSPLRTLLQGVAALDGEAWLRLRAAWGRFVLAAAQALVLLALLDRSTDSYAVAPLLLAAASVLAHHAVLHGSLWRHVAAAGEVLLALHADFVVPSALDREDVVWVLLLLWAALLLVPRLVGRALAPSVAGRVAAVLAVLAMAHVFYHHPGSTTGLWAVGVLAVLGALTPRATPAADSPEERLVSGLLLGVPAWLVYFSQAPLLERGAEEAFEPWAVLTAIATVFLTGLWARHYAPSWSAALAVPASPRLYHQALELAGRNGASIHTITLCGTTAVAALLQVSRYGRVYATQDLVLFLGLYLAAAVAWLDQGERRRSSGAYVVAELCLLGAFGLVRRQLMLTTRAWTYEYDVWASLALSLLLAGAKQAFDERPREQRLPWAGTLAVLPVAALSWTLVHHLGVDVALLVVGLHSLMFAYMGKDRADSPYNLVATAGFVAFVLMVFWSKLELRVLHAYVIPVGLGVLALLQMFGRELPADTRNRIRLVTLLAMLGSAGYYALVDDRYPVAFNLTLLLLCLAAMALGSVLRVRLYLVLGFAGVLVDLASILVKVLVRMERGERMTSVGLLVLLIGAALVGGAVYYKTHRDEIDRRLAAWRGRLGAWE